MRQHPFTICPKVNRGWNMCKNASRISRMLLCCMWMHFLKFMNFNWRAPTNAFNIQYKQNTFCKLTILGTQWCPMCLPGSIRERSFEAFSQFIKNKKHSNLLAKEPVKRTHRTNRAYKTVKPHGAMEHKEHIGHAELVKQKWPVVLKGPTESAQLVNRKEPPNPSNLHMNSYNTLKT